MNNVISYLGLQKDQIEDKEHNLEDANQGSKEPENKADDFNVLNVVQGTDVVQNLDREQELVEGTTPSEKEVHSVSNEGLFSSTSPPRTPKKAKGLNEFYTSAMNENQARLVQEGRSFIKGDTSLPRFNLITPTPPTSQDTPVSQEENAQVTEKEVQETSEKENDKNKEDDSTSKV